MMTLELTLQGADVLLPEGLVPGAELSLAEGAIVADRAGRAVDLSGYLVLPGIIDLHGDGFERHLAPRRGAMKQMGEGVIAAEAELAANGITTAVLAQFHSWEGGLRAPDYADQVFAAITAVRDRVVTDILPQLRFETHMLDDYAGLPQRIAAAGVGYVVFNDHLPHDRLAAGKKPPRLVGQALKAGRNPEVHWQMLQDMHARSDEVPAALNAICAELGAMGVRLGSHDDQNAAMRAEWRGRGVRISEFPETLEAAEAARAGGDHIILGSPNVVRGGSHKGNVSAVELIAMGLCDAIASDYHYPSPRRAALMLARSGLLDLAGAWDLVSKGPAEVLGLEDRGELAPGKRADVVILEKDSQRVAATLSGGRVSYMSGDIAARFLG
ncbi:alpha-D-ribose 1-methylphosphonate 5-triphosphate diphosphatase [Phaeobacter gallaeciensis]|uniref:alpha-D-ribose 1-methylphosphonate 5-triphosphate diphosphatase n=1 Tax=Phaeobacter gallaeciensis TaxID=60890 RepID=UPI00237EEA9F|nr:alpha-D-ribose 1-methylphosphonate 5-triphosphate diphosphatase [Phaeobacter gallaeciensis]MDE4097657.1 alpha-D-ribose 1-methylphosphonate 5-triphosphate diphosphatase [Phaeobacter gallaeciensis]MDE4106505.1 alpha-D-ribose 1-methylphosphonate 5-triphosphate diphosphatase [Phaeobacter gallaeciensis]MDE4110921.1 alpha-D-ribose 1-methylphosphonate 5-triphosphate diphosphatase [Phaeobacter gallaeciensis]MDE4115430.1 alpha-D-ribose 1-methylphosphonate 5-triphosphate diphosphatase [Phaeobacter gal